MCNDPSRIKFNFIILPDHEINSPPRPAPSNIESEKRNISTLVVSGHAEYYKFVANFTISFDGECASVA
jgi:hypothetical protein